VTVLLIGSGGREHALAWRIARDSPGVKLLAAPGNPGIADLAQCVPIATGDLDGLLALARAESAGLTIVGPEAPLAAGIVDRFRTAGLPIFGPTAGAARIETSKAFAKSLMERAGVPTARATICDNVEAALRAVDDFGVPVVIKASGLAAGKGVVVCNDLDEARIAVRAMLAEGRFGDAGSTVLVEEFMEGEELSVFFVTDGQRAIPLVPAQDHKRLLDNDRGPNTGGMGAYAPVSIETTAGRPLMPEIMDRVIAPVLAGLEEAGSPFTGLLYAGLMLTASGPKVVEFNCRFGDPETQAVLPRLRTDLLDLFEASREHGGLAGVEPEFADDWAVTLVLASAGYPESSSKGDVITGLDAVGGDVEVTHAGTARTDAGIVTAGGRVLNVTALGSGPAEARDLAYAAAAKIEFDGKQMRTDIAARAANAVASK
jgi:phosphoribosylamine--glycine ligase